MKNYSIKSILLFSLSIVSFVACKKDQDSPPATPDGTVSFTINPVVGAQTFAFGVNFTDDFGTVYQFTRAEFYLSNMVFWDDDSNIVMQPGKYLIVRPTTASYALGSTSADHIHEADLTIGIDSLTNHTDPTTYAVDNNLSPQVPSLHWSWSSGYIFCAVEGLADRNADGIPEAAFQFHIGTDALRKVVNIHIHHNITAGTNNTITLKIDYGKFFSGINLSDPNSSTHTMDNMTLATQFVSNMDSVFTVQ